MLPSAGLMTPPNHAIAKKNVLGNWTFMIRETFEYELY
jgi:hypothetical protein